MAGLVSNVPQLIWLSKHKTLVFVFAGSMLLLSALLRLLVKDTSCPIDPDLARACTKTKRFSNIVYIFSLCIYITGVFFAYVAPRIF